MKHINEIENDGKSYMVIGFNKITNPAGTYLVKLSLTQVSESIEKRENQEEIYSINYFKTLFQEIFSVLAPYQYFGKLKTFDIIKNGRLIKSMSDFATKREMHFYEKYTSYGLGLKKVKVKADIWQELDDQFFARCYNPSIKETFIIPCSEIYRAYIGKYETAMVDATFLHDIEDNGYKLFNLPATLAGEETVAPNKYIHLRKEFTKKSALPIYRYYSNPDFKKCFDLTKANLKAYNYIATQFPVNLRNQVIFRAVKLVPGVYLVLRIDLLKLEVEDPKCLHFDRDNSAGKKINEDTKVNPKTGVRGSFGKDDPTNLPTKHGPVDPISPTIDFSRYESIDDQYEKEIEILEVKKEYKKTIREKTKIIKTDPSYKGFGDYFGIDKNNNKLSHSTVTLTFENALADLVEPLKDLKYFSNVEHYLGTQFHALTEDQYAIKGNQWAYDSIIENKVKSRAICVLELTVENQKFYIVEIQPKAGDHFAMGIICMPNLSEALNPVAFKDLKEAIIKHKGIFRKIDKSLFRVEALKHYSKRLSSKKKTAKEEDNMKVISKKKEHDPKEYSKAMARNIMEKIKSIK